MKSVWGTGVSRLSTTTTTVISAKMEQTGRAWRPRTSNAAREDATHMRTHTERKSDQKLSVMLLCQAKIGKISLFPDVALLMTSLSPNAIQNTGCSPKRRKRRSAYSNTITSQLAHTLRITGDTHHFNFTTKPLLYSSKNQKPKHPQNTP